MSNHGLYQYSTNQLKRELENRDCSSFRVRLNEHIHNLYWDFCEGKITDQKLKAFFAATIDQRFV